MNRRVTAFALCLLYLAFVVVASTQHHNHEGGAACPHRDCIACSVHINAVAEVPVTIAVVSCTFVEFAAFDFDPVASSSYLFPSTASRAPPSASA